MNDVNIYIYIYLYIYIYVYSIYTSVCIHMLSEISGGYLQFIACALEHPQRAELNWMPLFQLSHSVPVNHTHTHTHTHSYIHAYRLTDRQIDRFNYSSVCPYRTSKI